MIAEVIFRHVFCRKTAKNGVMIVLLMRQHNLSYSQLFNCRINKTEKAGCITKTVVQPADSVMRMKSSPTASTNCLKSLWTSDGIQFLSVGVLFFFKQIV